MSERFHISDNNPNDSVGGGGCVCSELKCEDCKPPYAVFYGTEMANNLSPHTVLSLGCAKAFARKSEDPGELLSAGEKDPDDEELSL